LPYEHPDRLVALWAGRGTGKSELMPAEIRDWQQQTKAFSSIVPYFYSETMTVSGKEGPELVRVRRVDANFFRLLGVTPSKGRDFRDEDDAPGAHRVAIVSHGYWQTRFG
jgi:hypothetical protein